MAGETFCDHVLNSSIIQTTSEKSIMHISVFSVVIKYQAGGHLNQVKTIKLEPLSSDNNMSSVKQIGGNVRI